MDTLPLPPRPSLEQYRKRAKDLVTTARSEDPDAIRAWAAGWLGALARSLGVTVTPFVQHSFDRAVARIAERVREKTAALSATGERFTLADAQSLIAQAHGFESWPAFASHVQPDAREEGNEFEAAVDAVVGGDLATLASLVRLHPELIRARSTRVHRATLLHYVAANGVEDFRQKTPPDAVAVARFLLEAGAEVDALANTYGGGKDQTTMNLLVSSTHPADAGLQGPLVETLLDFGAAINGVANDSSPLMTALAFAYREAADVLARRGARVDNVITAAGVGRVDLVRRLVVDAVTLDPDVPLAPSWPHWLAMPGDAKARIELAFVWACKLARVPVAELLLDRGVDPAASDGDQMTALHWAAANGAMELIRRLVERGAPLEVENTWGGTVLDSTVHFAVHQPIKGVDYPRVIAMLIAAGADAGAVTVPTGNARIDELLRPRR
jgi:ankyrin repeat protein